MSRKGLVLNLGPGERVLINGALIENGDRRAQLLVATPDSRVLRLRDAILPDQATTPVRRVCLAAQRLVAGETATAEGRDQLLMGLRELTSLFRDGEGSIVLDRAIAYVARGRFYHAWRALRSLLPLEETLPGVIVPKPDVSEECSGPRRERLPPETVGDGFRPVAGLPQRDKPKPARRQPSRLAGPQSREQSGPIALREDTGEL